MSRPLLAFIGFMLFFLLLAPSIAPYDPVATHPEISFMPPDRVHLLGTDSFGRDVLSRILHGGRLTLGMTLLATLLAVFIGTALGFLTGIGSFIGSLFLVVISTLQSLPGFLLGFIILTIMGGGTIPLILACGIPQIGALARTVHGGVVDAKRSAFVEASIATGANSFFIWRNHIFSTVLPLILTYTGIVFSYTLFSLTAFTSLGLMGEIGIPEWGTMLAEGRGAFRTAPWLGFYPGLLITLTIFWMNRIIDRFTATP